MDTLKQLREEFTEEYQTTKKFLDRFPDERAEYSPHPKSTKMMPLAKHLVEIFGWTPLILQTGNLDFSEPHESPQINNRADLQRALETNYNTTLTSLQTAEERDLEPNWSISMGDQKLAEWNKYGAIRHALNQITHHRAQLGTYYRQLDIDLPSSYGPSADHQGFE